MLVVGIARLRRWLLQALSLAAVTVTVVLSVAGRPSWWARFSPVTAALAGPPSPPAAPLGEVTLVLEPPGLHWPVLLYRDGWEVGAFDGGPLTVTVHDGDTLSVVLPSRVSSLSNPSATLRVLAVSADVRQPLPGTSWPLRTGSQTLGAVRLARPTS